jgi:hypothetical protein
VAEEKAKLKRARRALKRNKRHQETRAVLSLHLLPLLFIALFVETPYEWQQMTWQSGT